MNYYENFTADIFEDFFSTLYKIIHKEYKFVYIHMNEANYYKWWVENISTSSMRKQEIIDWLNAHDIAFSDELRKPKLLKLVQINKKKVSFSYVNIAE